VISGMIYAVEFEATPDNTINYFTNTANNYAEGQFYSNESGFTPEPIIDLDFEVCVNGCPSSSPPAGIPTLSEWGLLILALLLMTFGTLYLVQPSVRHSFEQER
ncbi:MAG: IPTL-CTERM sorting domain-containing protein, partial [Chitinophagales bacterium]